MVIAVKNGAPALPTCLESVFGQTGVSAETLVVDGGSTDGTKQIVQANVSRLAFALSEPDTGVYAAWNKALRKARGEWLCFLSCDDVFTDALALRDLVRAASLAECTARVWYGKVNLVTASGVVAQTLGRPWADCRKDFLGGVMIPGPATLHHRSLFERHGRFDESYRIAGDYEFLLRELKQGSAGFVDRVVVNMKLRGLSNRPDSIYVLLKEVSRARRAHGLIDSPLRLRLGLAASWIGARIHRVLGERVFTVLADLYRVVRGKPRVWTR